MFRRTCIAGLFVIAVAGVTAAAADDAADCKSTSNDNRAIAACTRVIASGKFTGKDLGRFYYARGLKRRYNHAYDAAISDFTNTIKLDAKDTWAYVARGHAYAYKKNFPRAFADQETAIKLEKTAVTHTGRAIDLIEAGAYDRAIADLDEALRLDPKYFYAYLNRGDAYRKKRDFTKAEADYRKALEIKPNESEATKGLKKAQGRLAD
ncbi:MAG: tetratricopeptide repeat protein [Pseudolabrys sp.]